MHSGQTQLQLQPGATAGPKEGRVGRRRSKGIVVVLMAAFEPEVSEYWRSVAGPCRYEVLRAAEASAVLGLSFAEGSSLAPSAWGMHHTFPTIAVWSCTW